MNELDKRANRLKLKPRPKPVTPWRYFVMPQGMTENERLENERYTQVKKLLR